MKRILVFFTLMLTACLLVSSKASDRFAVKAGQLFTGKGEVISPAFLLVDNGKIKDVMSSPGFPEEFSVLDFSDGVIIPGLVDAHSHVGLLPFPKDTTKSDLNEIGQALTPMVDIMDSLNFWDPTTFQLAVEAGVTSVMVIPGSFNVFGGIGAILKTAGEDLDRRILRPEGILKMALGINPKYGGKKFSRLPQTRMGVRHLMWKSFQEAAEYKKDWDVYLQDQKKNVEPDLDLAMEPLRRALEREMPVHIHCARADDIIMACNLARDFGLDISLGHVYEGYLVAEELARRNIPVVTGPMLSGWMYGRDPEKPVNLTGILADKGVKVAIMTDAVRTCDLLLQASYAVRLGMDEAEAMRAVTINAAEIMKVDERVGSLEPGKDADFVVLDGPPLEVTTSVLQVFIDGKKVFDSEIKR